MMTPPEGDLGGRFSWAGDRCAPLRRGANFDAAISAAIDRRLGENRWNGKPPSPGFLLFFRTCDAGRRFSSGWTIPGTPQIERAERWLGAHPHDAVLLLTLGQ
mgnify:CR=1 FL=1